MKATLAENSKTPLYVVKTYKKQFFELDIRMLTKCVVLTVEMFKMLSQKEYQWESFQSAF